MHKNAHTKGFDGCSTLIDMVRYIDLLKELTQKETSYSSAYDGDFWSGPCVGPF